MVNIITWNNTCLKNNGIIFSNQASIIQYFGCFGYSNIMSDIWKKVSTIERLQSPKFCKIILPCQPCWRHQTGFCIHTLNHFYKVIAQ